MGKKGGGADSGKEKSGGADSGKENKEKAAQAEPKTMQDKKKPGFPEAKTGGGPGAGKEKTAESPDSESSGGALMRLRQRRWPLFFCIYVLSCAWLVGTYDACNVKGKRRDCGHAGITTMECMTTACLTKGGGKTVKKTVKLEPKGEPLGMMVEEDTASDSLTIMSINAGVLAEYNAVADSEDRVLSGDVIIKVDSASTIQAMKKAMKKTDKAVTLVVQRSKLPWYLMWIRTFGKSTFLEKMWTAPGFQKWSRSVYYIGGYGFLCWLISGYPPASLPVYYFSISGFTAFMLSRCCYDDNVHEGVPHCYKGNSPNVEDAVMEAWAQTQKTLGKTYAEIAKDPQKYFKSFIPKF